MITQRRYTSNSTTAWYNGNDHALLINKKKAISTYLIIDDSN